MRNSIVRLIEKCASESLRYAESDHATDWLGIQPSPAKKSKISDEKETQKKYEEEKQCRSFKNSFALPKKTYSML
jgi:hypothetical protein